MPSGSAGQHKAGLGRCAAAADSAMLQTPKRETAAEKLKHRQQLTGVDQHLIDLFWVCIDLFGEENMCRHAAQHARQCQCVRSMARAEVC